MPLPKLKQPDNHTNFNSGGQPPAGVKLTTLSYLLGARRHPWWAVNYIIGRFLWASSPVWLAGLVPDALYRYRRSHRA